MARYFFDVGDSDPAQDDIGTECANLDDVRVAAMSLLPAVAKDQIPANGDHRIFSVIARDDAGQAVYAATLSFVGFWISRKHS